ncbi:MAG: DUF4340 domain-containing protein [Steroidobacteraceae bacterium]
MTPRRAGLVGLAALLAVAGSMWLANQRHLERETPHGALLLPGLRAQLNAVNEVRLQGAAGVATTLRRDAAGWSVAERRYEADLPRLRRLLLDLADLRIVEEKTHDRARYPILGVEDVRGPGAGGVRIDLAAGAQRWSLIVGKSAGADGSYVRVSGQDASYLARPQLGVTASPQQWLATALLDLPAATIRSASVTLPGQPAYLFVRAAPTDGAKDANVPLVLQAPPRGREPRPDAPAATAAALAGLALEDVQAAALQSAAGERIARARFETVDGLTIELSGREDGPRRLVSLQASATTGAGEAARRQATALGARLGGREFEIANYRYGNIFRPLEDLLKPR